MRVTIYQPSKTAMQSGTRRTKQWRMAFESDGAPFIEPLMGWVGSKDTTPQVDLYFDSEEEACEYARRKGYDFTVKRKKAHVIPPKSYADNFKTNKVRT
jgi:hypothetical protein